MAFFDWSEPYYLITLAVVSWIAVAVVWLIFPDNPEYALGVAVIAVILTILAAVFFFIPIGETGSARKIDKATGKQRCRVCHQYFDELIDGKCHKCHQTVQR